MDYYTISQLAQKAGVNVETIRYYERINLIPKPPKNSYEYRKYPLSILDRIKFIKKFQSLGFSLRDISEILTLQEETSYEKVKKIFEDKLFKIEKEIRELENSKMKIEDLLNCLVSSKEINFCLFYKPEKSRNSSKCN
ncbi:MAG: MerR family transcriptional regulator [Leptospiraceae bacterium]|nr:MerR family transcriptional regulator [Leptospiraceae bacterium]